MQRKKIFNYLELAARTAVKKDDQRSFLLGACAVRKDGKLVSAWNGPSQMKMREAHAEYRLSSKLDVGSVVYVARVRLKDGSFGISRPCASCLKILLYKGVSRVYYTVSDNEIGIIDMKRGSDIRKFIEDYNSYSYIED